MEPSDKKKKERIRASKCPWGVPVQMGFLMQQRARESARERERGSANKRGVDRPLCDSYEKINKQQLLTLAFALVCATQAQSVGDGFRSHCLVHWRIFPPCVLLFPWKLSGDLRRPR